MLYRRDYRISSEKQMSNLRSRRGEGCSLDRVQKVYAAGGILGARPLTQFQSCIGSETTGNMEHEKRRKQKIGPPKVGEALHFRTRKVVRVLILSTVNDSFKT